jgi:L-ectoine synthase
MIIRTKKSILGTDLDVDWGNGTSRRLLVASDERGYTITDTYVRPGTTTELRFDNHLESCYCVEGQGTVEVDGTSFAIEPGTLYAPDKGEVHVLSSADGMRLICVFNPPLVGTETHEPGASGPSGY